MRSLILLLLLSVCAQAKTVTVPAPVDALDIDLAQIEADIRAAGHNISHTICSGTRCTVTLPDASPANVGTLTPFFVAARARSQKRADESAREEALLSKLDAGIATQAEIAETLRLLRKK
jgi:alpha-D-ribose 1-methylphosphonate 5-triphosphate synthase subunit PhnG